MKTVIITSKKDIAGMNIKDCLLNLFNFKEADGKFDNNSIYELNIWDKIIKLYTINDDTVHAENLDKKIDADLFIFATRHSAKAGVKTLCIHTPGNWKNADLGGSERKLCISVPSLLKEGLIYLNGLNKINYEATLEATHHGPFIEKPCFFIEIGSSEKEWQDKRAVEVIAKTIIKLLEKHEKIPEGFFVSQKSKAFQREKREYKTAFGIGGTHYATNFNKIILKTDIAIGHICPKYALQYLDEEMVNQAIEKTQEKVDFVLLDWKGLGKEKQRIIELLKKLDIKYKRTNQIK